MLSNEEIDYIETDVASMPDSKILGEKKKLIAVGIKFGQDMGSMMNVGVDHSGPEKEMHLVAEYLTFIDQRLEGKDSWWFRVRRRLKYVNQFLSLIHI